MPRCDGSEGKAEDVKLKCPGFNPLLRQEFFSCLRLVALEPMRTTSNLFAVLLQLHTVINSHENGSVRCMQVLVTIQGTGD